MKKRTVIIVAALALALAAAAAAPRPAAAVSFVDKQVQAGGLLLQSYVDAYGAGNQFKYPAPAMVKKGGGLTAPIWPSNPWTGKIMSPGSARGTYTYKLVDNGLGYKLTLHLSKGNYPLKGGMPSWMKAERDTASKQNLLVLQWYVQSWAASHGGYPAPADMTPAVVGASKTWPVNPWTGAAMAASEGFGDFSYAQTAGGYSLKVKLSSGKWSDALGPTGVAPLAGAPQ